MLQSLIKISLTQRARVVTHRFSLDLLWTVTPSPTAHKPINSVSWPEGQGRTWVISVARSYTGGSVPLRRPYRIADQLSNTLAWLYAPDLEGQDRLELFRQDLDEDMVALRSKGPVKG